MTVVMMVDVANIIPCNICVICVTFSLNIKFFSYKWLFFIHITITVNRCVLTSDKINAFDFNLFGENEFMFELWFCMLLFLFVHFFFQSVTPEIHNISGNISRKLKIKINGTRADKHIQVFSLIVFSLFLSLKNFVFFSITHMHHRYQFRLPYRREKMLLLKWSKRIMSIKIPFWKIRITIIDKHASEDENS